ncbi:MAG: TetR/AcrR family transcriptional regulator [Anaerohalosphaera sp.]|nr:TetR/AcrR family transcriptional regulator [Anaerohalosphaera sp.]
MSKQAAETKNRILNAARTLYATHGCDGTTLDDILTASGVTKGAFYHYFKSKDSICETLIEIITDDYQQLFDSIDKSESPIDQLKGLVHKLDELNLSGKWQNCKLMLKLSADSHQTHHKTQQSIDSFWRWYFGQITQMVFRCRNANQLTTEIPIKIQTKMILSVMAGAITLERIDPDDHRFAHITNYVIDSMMA